MAAADHRGVVVGVISLDVLHHQLVLHLLAADRALYHVVHLRLGRAAPAAPAVGTAALADVGGELSLVEATRHAALKVSCGRQFGVFDDRVCIWLAEEHAPSHIRS